MPDRHVLRTLTVATVCCSAWAAAGCDRPADKPTTKPPGAGSAADGSSQPAQAPPAAVAAAPDATSSDEAALTKMASEVGGGVFTAPTELRYVIEEPGVPGKVAGIKINVGAPTVLENGRTSPADRSPEARRPVLMWGAADRASRFLALAARRGVSSVVVELYLPALNGDPIVLFRSRLSTAQLPGMQQLVARHERTNGKDMDPATCAARWTVDKDGLRNLIYNP